MNLRILSILSLMLACGTPSISWAQTHRTLPANNATFITDLQNFLRYESADRLKDGDKGFIVSGGVHATSGSMVSASFATTGYTTDGIYVSQSAAAINYTTQGCAAADTAWVIIDSATTGNLSNFVRVAGTRYLVDCVSTTQPALPSTSAWLMEVTIAGSALTTVRRPASGFCTNPRCEVINVKDTLIGAVGDGVANDTAALNTALAIRGAIVYMPPGNYLVTSNLAVPYAHSLIGAGWLETRLTAQTGVTTVLQIEAPVSQMRRLENFSIYGNATASARGIILGANAVISHVQMTSVFVRNFTGTGAIGIYFRDIIKSTFRDLFTTGCTVNWQFEQGAAGATPTTLEFYGGITSGAVGTGRGAAVITGYNIIFRGTIFESNAAEGLIVIPGAGGTATTIWCEDCWFEANYTSNTAQFQTAFYGNAGGGATVLGGVRGGHWAGGGAKSILVTGSGARVILESPYVPNSGDPNYAGGITVSASASVKIADWHPHIAGDFYSIVSGSTDTDELVSCGGPWASYTPTYSSNIGNNAATWAAGVNTNTARYRRCGKTLHLHISFQGALLAVTPLTLRATLPNGWLTKNNLMYTPCIAHDNNLFVAGTARSAGDANVYFYLLNTTSLYTSGGVAGSHCTLTLELQ